MAHDVIFVLSTGRCGTQWLANTLGDVYRDCVESTHEPLGARYRPKYYLRDPSLRTSIMREEEILQHLQYIEKTSEDRVYIETGWPAFAWIPEIYRRFGGRLKLLHIVRHPVPAAMSMLTHDYYRPERRDDIFTQCALLDPFCEGIVQKDYRAIWTDMNRYEKCLFHWTEINAYADELERSLSCKFMRIDMREMMENSGDGLVRIMEYFSLPFRKQLIDQLKVRKDLYSALKSDDMPPWEYVYKHDYTIKLADKYGMDVGEVDLPSLTKRYHRSRLEKARNRMRRIKHGLVSWKAVLVKRSTTRIVKNRKKA